MGRDALQMSDFYWTPDVFLMLFSATFLIGFVCVITLLVALRVKEDTITMYRYRCRDFQRRVEAAESLARRAQAERIDNLIKSVQGETP